MHMRTYGCACFDTTDNLAHANRCEQDMKSVMEERFKTQAEFTKVTKGSGYSRVRKGTVFKQDPERSAFQTAPQGALYAQLQLQGIWEYSG